MALLFLEFKEKSIFCIEKINFSTSEFAINFFLFFLSFVLALVP